MSASSSPSHPVEIECPCCTRRFRVPLKALSVGRPLTCQGCAGRIEIATPALRQLLREIENDLRTPDDLPLLLRPTKCRPSR